MEAGRMEDDQQFCLRWNNHQSTLVSVFDTLLEKGIHVDCTLAAEGQTLRAHKVVLSACSPYFESVLSQQYDKHPIIILKDVKYAELRAMMDYMYRGEVNISQEQLGALLKAAESLQIKGLSDNKPPRHNAHPPRPTTPPTKTRDSSTESREGSTSPTRRRKKIRRNSASPTPAPLPVVVPPTIPASVPGPVPVAVPVPVPKEESCKEEPPGVEDLTIDEEADQTQAPHDVVRNFQWHIDRSQDDLMSPGDGRDTQDRRISPRSIVTRSKKITETSASILTVLKNAKPPPERPPAPAPAPVLVLATNPVPAPQNPVAPTTPAETKGVRRKGADSLDKKYQCIKCGRRYNARRNLVRHMTLECGREPRYKCPYCAYTKHRRNELKRHIEKKHPTLAPTTTAPLTVN